MERLDNSKLSALQKHIVNAISGNKNVAVVGGPGTGKTILAMSGMNLGGNRKQILLTYSKPLSIMISECRIPCRTLHSFCWQTANKIEEFLKDYESEYKFDDDPLTKVQVINKEYVFTDDGFPRFKKLINAYNRLTENQKKELRYDDIFVDEGQDFPEEAFEFLKLLTNRIVVTYDEAQEVGGENSKGENALKRKAGVDCNKILNILSLQDSFYDLIDNFRNTKSIERVAKLFYNNYGSNDLSLRRVAANRPEGKKPKAIFSPLSQKLFDDIADRAYQLNKQVGVIIPEYDANTFKIAKEGFESAIDNGLLPENKFFYKYGKDKNMDSIENDLNQTGVFLITYKTSKGMEFDDVYLLDCQNSSLQTETDKNRFYVAATRAKETLNLVFSCTYESSCPVLEVVKNNESLFEIAR